MIFDRERGDIHRLSHIIGVLMKYEFGPWVDGISKEHRFSLLKKLSWYKQSRALNLSKAARLRMTFEELGPIFVKFGQMLSTRADIFKREYVEELSKLQDSAPAFSWEEAEGIIKTELGREPPELFELIEKTPLASASLGQVHEAVLKGGRRVVIKVQRPDIIREIEQDIRLMRYLSVFLVRNNPDWESYNLPGLIDEFDRSIHREVDYRFEGRYADKFRKIFENDKTVYVPRILWEYSTEKILVMEYVDGVNLKYLITECKKRRNRIVAERIMNSYLKQIFEHQFFHADPHPSNIFVLPDNTICYLDFGMMKHLGRDFTKQLSSILMSIFIGDLQGLVENLQTANILGPNVDKERLIRELEDVYTLYYESPSQAKIGQGLERILEIFAKYRMRVPEDYAMLIRSFIVVEGTVKQLNPKIDMVEHVKEYLSPTKELKFVNIKKITDFKDNLVRIAETMGGLPDAISKFSKSLATASITVDFKHQSLEELSKNLDRISNRISASILLAAILVGSSLIMTTGQGPLFFDFPVVGIVGFTFALILGSWMVVRIIRRAGI
ncbi:MAG: AarF/ABC1/UbiB kinase family protein [Candidatus Altiarchaeota archaeon]|nr:AarF/ABC1/UbiB kinase family protein [Candidatus Altiarchaeota archaeon]